jgi:zinc transporter 1/2/3
MSSASSVCNQVGVSNYSNPIHIAGLFVILCGGFLGAFLPVASKHYPWLRIPNMVLQLGRAFGTGVVIATGFVHMMPPALGNLSNSCLPGFFTDTYDSLGAAIALAAALFMQVLEFTGRVYIGHYMQRLKKKRIPASSEEASIPPSTTARASSDEGITHAIENDASALVLANAEAKHLSTPEGNTYTEASLTGKTRPMGGGCHDHFTAAASDEERGDAVGALDEAELRNLKLLVIVFEFGVAVHSVVVGLDFGVSTGQTAVTLFAALIFHQFFEGVALGTTISEAGFDWWLVLLMVISFALETPIGTAIGMGIARAYNPESVASLVTRGVLDGLSAGILIYTGLVDLLTYRFTLNTALHVQPLLWIVLTIAFVWAGAVGMSIIGAWI